MQLSARNSALTPRVVLVALFGALAGACFGTPVQNPEYYKDRHWSVSGPARFDEIIVCENARAYGANDMVEAIESTIAPELAQALERDASTLKLDRHASGSGLCAALGKLNGGNFHVNSGLRAVVQKSFTECPTCESLVVPTVFVWWESGRSEIRDRTGQTVGSIENGRPQASGEFYLRVFVFTKSGDLAYNSGALLDGKYFLSQNTPGAVKDATRGFPRHILTK
jgi:hypothetical protein